MSFGKLIFYYLNKHSLSTSQLAEIVGTTRVTMDNICRDTHTPNLLLGLKLIRFFRIPQEKVLDAVLNKPTTKND